MPIVNCARLRCLAWIIYQNNTRLNGPIMLNLTFESAIKCHSYDANFYVLCVFIYKYATCVEGRRPIDRSLYKSNAFLCNP